MNKKAQFNPVSEASEVLLGIAALILMVVFVGYMLFQFQAAAVTMDFFNIPIMGDVFAFMLNYPVIFDWVVLAIYFLAFIASVYGLSRVEIGSVMYILSFFLLVIAGFAFWVVGYLLDAVITLPIFADVVSNMLFIPFYASNVVLFTMLYGFACLLALHIPNQ